MDHCQILICTFGVCALTMGRISYHFGNRWRPLWPPSSLPTNFAFHYLVSSTNCICLLRTFWNPSLDSLVDAVEHGNTLGPLQRCATVGGPMVLNWWRHGKWLSHNHGHFAHHPICHPLPSAAAGDRLIVSWMHDSQTYIEEEADLI